MPITADVTIGKGARIIHPDLVNMFGCSVGDGTMIGPFVEVQRGVHIGERCKIQSHSFICEGVKIDDEVFIGHGVMFTNDRWPRAAGLDGRVKDGGDWVLEETYVGKGASIGSGAVILPGLRIGSRCLVAAGAVVTKDVPDFALVVGSPARHVADVRDREPGMETLR